MKLRVSDDELRDLLVTRLAVLNDQEFERARSVAGRLRIPLARALVERGRVPFRFLFEQLAQLWGVGFIDLAVSDVEPETLGVIPVEYARANTLIPFARKDGHVCVAMADPRDHKVIDEIRKMIGMAVAPYLAPPDVIRRAHLLYRGDLRDMLEAAARDLPGPARGSWAADERSMIELVNRILEYAAVARASDIHVEPYELEVLVRYRIDGVLREVLSLPPAASAPLSSRIKILAGLRIDERRAAQDGRFEADLNGLRIDFRVSIVPTLWGEKLVLRALSKQVSGAELEDLGLADADLDIVLRNILRPFGMILVTGPTGSGKSTTLYAMLTRVGVERQNLVNISTIEDPVEYTMPRVNQIPVNASAGVEFASGLRALLRQDPDVIMVGEMRDRETAEIGVRAALVGRLLLSTLHTNDATGAIPRLLDMGVEPYLLASTLALVAGQRLVRRICPDCRESVTTDGATLTALHARPDFEETADLLRRQGILRAAGGAFDGVRTFQGRGCRQCGGSGYRGRVGIFELFEVDSQISEMIVTRRDAGTIRAAALAGGMKTMFQDGLAKVLLGETTLAEVTRAAL